MTFIDQYARVAEHPADLDEAFDGAEFGRHLRAGEGVHHDQLEARGASSAARSTVTDLILIPLRGGSGNSRRMKAVSSASGSRTIWADVGRVAQIARQGECGAADVHDPDPFPRGENGLDHVGDPLDVVEFEASRVVESTYDWSVWPILRVKAWA